LNIKNSFSSENLLLSVAGHLLLVVLMLTTIHLAIEQSKLVAPDRVIITEIDLTQVKITRDETQVYNTDTPKEEKRETKDDPKEKPEPAPIPDALIEKPTLVDVPDITATEKPKEKPGAAKPKPDEPTEAPKQRMIVRVNRETAALNRTMTVSVVDALRIAMTRCWVFDHNYPDIDGIRAVVHLLMNTKGYVQNFWFEQESAAAENPSLAYIFETIRSAISNCQPFSMLPESEYDAWKSIQLSFYPSNGDVQ
jgi:outer membrane biosynthesis protein TonB